MCAKRKSPTKRVRFSSKDSPAIAKDVIFRKNPDHTIAILRLDESEHIYTLDGVAAEAWLLIDSKRTIEEILSALDKSHPDHADEIRASMTRLFVELQKEALIGYRH